MEPDVIRMYSSSPPPMEEGAEEDDDEFSDFAGVPSSISFTEFDTPTTFNQLQALNATSPPELIGNGRIVGRGPAKPNGSVPGGGQGDGAPCRTVTMEELKKTLELPHGTYTNFTDVSATARTGSNAVGRNGNVGGVEVLTNGFATFDGEETSLSCCKRREASPSVDYHPGAVANDDDEEFADFSAFSDVDFPSHFDQESGGGADWEDSNLEGSLVQDNVTQPPAEGALGAGVGSVVEEGGGDACVTGFVSLAFSTQASGCLSNGDWGFHAGSGHEQEELKADNSHKNSNTAESISTEPLKVQNSIALNGLEVQETVDNRVSPGLEDERGRGSEQPEERGSGNDTETETETETSFGRPLSTDALEEFGDFSTTGSVPSPPLQEETATPADHSQLAEDDDEDFADFGDFGDASSFGATGFADFDQQGAAVQKVPSESASQANLETTCANEDEYGDFDAPKDPSHAVQEAEDSGGRFVGFPGSDSFADFSSAPVDGGGHAGSEWQAFNDPDSSQGAGGSWATFGRDHGSAFSQKRPDDWHEDQAGLAPPTGSAEDRRKNSITASLFHRLEKLFLASFPEACVPQVGAPVPPLRAFLEPMNQSERDENSVTPTSGALQDVWRQLQDIHNAFGLRHQWGGSHSNKTLLCSLGIDTRNILFTGQKKQPVIVPMYAASLGMLEPTKEPVKPVSAAEMIASIAQSPTVATEMGTCRTDAVQEPLPPVQFDWSSSGLTNPLDASGGSSLLNLDFFGPVDESLSSSATSIPGVDPELYELTQAKMEVGGGRVADAFARLMSTVEKTNTSTRRAQVRKEENHSEEARRVIASLPDLSFMQAKVLMFPSTLTPLPLSSSSSSSPVPD